MGNYNVDSPLDWWAEGGFKAVCDQYARLEPDRDWCYPGAKRRAYKRVHGALHRMYERTGDPVWRPHGNNGHERLRKRIRTFKIWNYDLL